MLRELPTEASTDIWILFAIILIVIVIFSPITYNLTVKLFKSIKRLFSKSTTEEQKITAIKEIEIAMSSLATAGKGATIVIDVKDETNEYVTDSELIDSRISANLLINIFEGSKTPLHDGAVIMKNNRIDRASAYITNLSKQKVPKSFGTRHRSALGLSEVTKAIIIVLSEETGKIRIFFNSKFEECDQRELFGKLVNLWV